MHPCSGNWVAIGCAVVYYTGLPMHLVQELNVGTVAVGMNGLKSCYLFSTFDVFILQTNSSPAFLGL